ncbi:hypothetical protein Ciccas_014002, partial [Cichlidogyrus casuarinus]
HLLQAVHQAPPTVKVLSYRQYQKQANIEALRLRKKMADELNAPGELIAACITTDGWTSKSMVHYQSLTLHYVTAAFAYRSVVLGAFQCGLSGSDFAQGALEQLRSFRISPKALYGLTTDGASNMMKMTREIASELDLNSTLVEEQDEQVLPEYEGSDDESDADVASDFEDSSDFTDSSAEESQAEDSVVEEAVEPTEIPQLEHVWCFCHRLHLIVTSVVYPKASTATSRLIERVRHVATKLRRSNSLWAAYVEACSRRVASADSNPVRPKLDMRVRWSSTLDMLQSIHSQLAGINFVVETDASKFTQLRSFSWRESDEILDLITLLRAFATPTTLFSAEHHPTLHLVRPALIDLHYVLETQILTTDLGKQAQQALMAEFERRLTSVVDDPLLLVAQYLDPKQRGTTFFSHHWKEVQHSLQRMVVSHKLVNLEDESKPNATITLSEQQLRMLRWGSKSHPGEPTPTLSPAKPSKGETRLSEEIKGYGQLNFDSPISTPLEFWSSAHCFPILRSCARI